MELCAPRTSVGSRFITYYALPITYRPRSPIEGLPAPREGSQWISFLRCRCGLNRSDHPSNPAGFDGWLRSPDRTRAAQKDSNGEPGPRRRWAVQPPVHRTFAAGHAQSMHPEYLTEIDRGNARFRCRQTRTGLVFQSRNDDPRLPPLTYAKDPIPLQIAYWCSAC